MFPGIWTHPLFLLHLTLYWTVCAVCFGVDLHLSRGGENDVKGKWGRYPVQIDWLIYSQAGVYSLVTQFVFLGPLIWLSSFFQYDVPWDQLGWYKAGLELLACVLVEEILFYYIHRAFHSNPTLWALHGQHHDLTTPVAVATLYATWQENLLLNVLPVVLSPLFSGLPSSLLPIWTVVATLTSTLSHSGFVKLGWLSKYHALHHVLGTSNFGVSSLMDRLNGTYIASVPPAPVKPRVLI